MSLPFKLTRVHAIVAAALVVVIVAGGVLVVYLRSPAAAIHAHLQVSDAKRVRVLEPLIVRFDQPVDLAKTQIKLTPAADFQVQRLKDRLVLAPTKSWDAQKTYTLQVGSVLNAKHTGTPLKDWKVQFTTANKVSVAAFKVDDKPVGEGALVLPSAKFSVTFTTPMKASTVAISANGTALAAGQLSWAAGDPTLVDLALGVLAPYQPLKLTVLAGANGSNGEVLLDNAEINLVPEALEPTNPASGIGPDFKPVTPIMIAIENSGDSRPQSGLQQADMVYEYVSEYQISRMTAVYFNSPPALIGPVRSCRMINPYIGFAFRSVTMCSGGSVGTLHYVFGNPEGTAMLPVTINDFDRGNHFFRSNAKAAPHNLYTSADRAVRLRSEYGVPAPNYALDPPHPDSTPGGTPAAAPAVGQHFVSYGYDGNAKAYLRFDHGTPFTDTTTGAQLAVKNVVILHTPFHDAGWVEDENGGAHSVWYDINGSGPAELYSDGMLIPAVWHMGAGNGQPYWTNHDPMWFSDPAGKPLQLNSGLTWIHVIGNGQ